MSPSDTPPTGNSTGSARKWSIVGIADLKTLMAKYGDTSPIYATEFGWSTHSNTGSEPNYKKGVTETQQGTYILGGFEELGKQGVVGAFVYTDRDMINPDIQEASFGLLRRDLSPKPGYFGLKCAASNVCSTSSSATIATPIAPKTVQSPTPTLSSFKSPSSVATIKESPKVCS
jgi:hypothetical protein